MFIIRISENAVDAVYCASSKEISKILSNHKDFTDFQILSKSDFVKAYVEPVLTTYLRSRRLGLKKQCISLYSF
ncbi:hypothetical protein lacNasYZ03_17710 [Lactobacillus nasalidis]|uniref:Uncharacterized protein n=1 Tax=Lactobacillus nasalidis TaxID=2797258 RepID=A0ABQ3W9R8_9LACO|nr:hypothetical protein lacNasYZ01_01520 [Lactobacillus nasalidis]GHV98577.1 hypothetical protein lacNasYZ02_00070 [Lactobacillus nasalidis]GHW02084.1 hypothetical protein lacNasYZ03_17710 [Lactobacillus nasalidis]